MRFYGLTYDQVMELPAEAGFELWKLVDVIEAQEALISMNVSAYPHMKVSDARELHKSIYKKAYPKIFESRKAISTEDLARVLSRGK